MRNYIFSTFHGSIIAFFCLLVIGCGYKKPPYYEEKKTQVDQNQSLFEQNTTLQESNKTVLEDNDIFFNETNQAEVL